MIDLFLSGSFTAACSSSSTLLHFTVRDVNWQHNGGCSKSWEKAAAFLNMTRKMKASSCSRKRLTKYVACFSRGKTPRITVH